MSMSRLPVFVESALQAICMSEDREYMIYEDKQTVMTNPIAEKHHFHRIIPVDYKVRIFLHDTMCYQE